MNIRITKQLPVEEHVRPEVGRVYEVVFHQSEGPIYRGLRRPEMFFIRVGLAQVGVRPDECEIVEASGTGSPQPEQVLTPADQSAAAYADNPVLAQA